MDPTLAPVAPQSPTSVAEATVQRLNTMLDSIGFYVGTERTVPIDRAVAASWLTIEPAERGTYAITANEAAIQQAVDALPAAINRDPLNAITITDSSGGVLREETVGVVGRTLDSTDGVASGFADQLSSFDAAFVLPVTEVPFTTTALARRIEVNLSEQHAYLFENENVIDSWPISSGLSGFDSATGHFRINAKLRTQNMGNPDLTKSPNYYTENVPWVMYYNGDEALHGAYWHNNFGNQMSHGCINMPLGSAEFAYAWAPEGTEVWVHY
jgi:lipoprotein-anchoring transpeptidase ErfK/SrfK